MNVCTDCYYSTPRGCNRLVKAGGFGSNDRVASDYKKKNQCVYYRHGEATRQILGDGSCNFWNS